MRRKGEQGVTPTRTNAMERTEEMRTLVAVEIDDFDNGKYIAKSEGECHDAIDAMVFARVKETGIAVAQGSVFGRPIFA